MKGETYWRSKIDIIIEHQKAIYLLGYTPNQTTKIRTKNWIEINDDSRGTYNTDSQIKFKTSMLRSTLCINRDADILVSGTIDWNKYQTKVLIERQNQYLGFLIDPRFHRVNRLAVLLFENQGDRIVHTGYSLAKVEVKDYNVMIDGKNFFDQPVKSDLRTYDNVWNISTGQGDDYTAGCLLDYNYFTKYYKMRAIYLSNQQVVDSDAKSIQQINFTGNIENQSTIIFIIEEAEETVLDFSQGTVKLVLILFFALI